jgi:four helix bundle protein
MGIIKSFRDLDAWRAAMDLAVLAHGKAKHLPASERFELASQIRRAAVSIPANVAEGQSIGRWGRYLFHVRVALGSLGELATHFELARRLEYFTTDENSDLEKQLERSAKLLHGLARSIRQKQIGTAAVGFAFLAGLAMGPLISHLA